MLHFMMATLTRKLRHLPLTIVNSELLILVLFLILQVSSSTLSSSISSDVNQGNSNSKTWTISKNLCLKNSMESSYCKCSSDYRSFRVVCSCDDSTPNQVIHLQGPPVFTSNFDRPTFLKIEKCFNVTVEARAFSTLQGVKFVELVLENIQHAEIKNDAFELGSPQHEANSPQYETNRTIIFKNVRIPNILSHSFPSNLNKVEFINSEIGTVSTDSFRAYKIQNVIFENTTVDVMESNSFTEHTFINLWRVKNSRFRIIKTNAIASGILSMSWVDSRIGNMESSSMSGTIANISFLRNEISVVEPNGMTFKEWTWVTLLNNTFQYVNESGIDLTSHAPTNFNITEINGNSWLEVETDFIVVGQTNSPVAIVLNNKFAQLCDCNKSFLSQVSLQKSKPWFYDNLRNNSHCSTTEKGAMCLQQEETFISYERWGKYCSPAVLLCMTEFVSEVSDVSYTPTVTASKLRVLVIFIGIIAIAIVACLIGVLCIYMCRSRQPRTSKMNGCATKSSSCSPPHSYVDLMPSKITQVSSIIRPRSVLLEDVGMEDKGVQTMPSELSTDVLEELRDKLARPDSFWDAKETIDHLYDLIQVQTYHSSPTTALSSPPDVTMCNTGITSTEGNKNTNNRKESIMTQTNTKPIPLPRYAQIKGKPKTAPVCEYGDPSDSQMHVYSELNNLMSVQNHIQHFNSVSGNEQRGNRPILCEYTEPKDVRAHVYAELGNSSNPVPYHQSLQRSSTQQNESNFLSLNMPTSQMRPLPSIPSSSSLVL